MKTVYVNLPDAETIQNFVDALADCRGQFDLISGHYILDARSMLGIFNLDLKNPIRLDVYEDSPENAAAIAPFLAEGYEGPDTTEE